MEHPGRKPLWLLEIRLLAIFISLLVSNFAPNLQGVFNIVIGRLLEKSS